MNGLIFPLLMRFFLPSSVFGILFAFSSIMKSVGWKWLSELFPAFAPYAAISERIAAIAAALAGLWFANVLAVFVLDKSFSRVLRSSPLAKKLLPLLKYAASALIWGFGLVFVLSLAGVNVSALLTGAGIGGLVFALASKELASNLFGSLSLIFGNFFKIHDRIRIKGYEGTVEEITLSYTRLTDKNGQTVFMPNKYLTAEPVENLTDSAFKTADIPVTLPSGTDVADFVGAVSKFGKNHPEAKAKATVTEIASSEIKVTLRVESPAEGFEACRATVVSNVAKYLKA